jgi:SAM-dependent methyltransferase
MPLSDDVLRARLATQQWTSHNIRLGDQLTTMPDRPDFMQTDDRLQAIRRTLRAIFGENLAGLKIADLGCLEGGFSLALAQEGAQVTGIEARSLNIEKCRLLKEHFDLPNLNFVQADVKDFNVTTFGGFHVTLALGILYHLDNPLTWLQQVAHATKTLMIVDTHFAPANDTALALLDQRLSALSPLTDASFGGHAYQGRWFHEFDPESDRETNLWASYSNNRSFWLTQESLLFSLRHIGFDLAYQQHDWTVDRYRFFAETYPRTMVVGVKSQECPPSF